MGRNEDSESVELKRKELEDYVWKNNYKIRSCSDYSVEYKECRRIKGRFHQYYINGEFSDCSALKDDCKNCKKCEEGDMEACVKLIERANDLLKRRMKAHLSNDVWERRTRPPEDWNKPLPSFLTERKSFKFLDEDKRDGQMCTIF